MLYLSAVQCSASRIACTLNIDHPGDSGQVLFCHRQSSHCCDCGSGYSRRTALTILHYETDHFDLMMRPAFSASFDWLGGVSAGVPSWLFCDFPCPRCCKSCKKPAIFATTFATMVAKRPLNTPRLRNISRIFPWYILRVFSSYGFLRSFCNKVAKHGNIISRVWCRPVPTAMSGHETRQDPSGRDDGTFRCRLAKKR